MPKIIWQLELSMVENDAGKITEEVLAIAGSIAAINLYLNKDEFIPPLLPKEEADEIRAENKQAMAAFAGHIIAALLIPKVAELALKGEPEYSRNSNIYHYCFSGEDRGNYKVNSRRSIGFNIKNSQPVITFSIGRGGTRPSQEIDSHYSAFQSEVSHWNPQAKENWDFEIKRTKHETPTDYESYSFTALRDLEPFDLAISTYFFHDFLEGSRKFLGRALREINSQTIPEEEAERLRRITQACLEGSALIEKALEPD